MHRLLLFLCATVLPMTSWACSTTVGAAIGHFETKDGAATLGVVTSTATEGIVKFVICSTNKTVYVPIADLRPSKAKCDTRPKLRRWPPQMWPQIY